MPSLLRFVLGDPRIYNRIVPQQQRRSRFLESSGSS